MFCYYSFKESLDAWLHRHEIDVCRLFAVYLVSSAVLDVFGTFLAFAFYGNFKFWIIVAMSIGFSGIVWTLPMVTGLKDYEVKKPFKYTLVNGEIHEEPWQNIGELNGKRQEGD